MRFIHKSYLMMTVCTLYIIVCLGVCLFACAAGLLYILLTGIKVFQGSGAKMREEEGSGANRRVEREAMIYHGAFPYCTSFFISLFFFYSWQDFPVHFIVLGAGKNVTTHLLARILQSSGHVVWLLCLIDGPTHQQVGHSTLPIEATHKLFLALMGSHCRPHTH